MKIEVKIDRKQIHHFIEDGKDILQFGVRFPEYPNLPTYGLRVDFPITKEKVIDAIRIVALKAKAQMKRDEIIRSQLNEVVSFNIEV